MTSKTAYDYSIRLLSKRDYSRFKLRQKLLQKEYSEAEIEGALQKLVNQRYLREEEYKKSKIIALLHRGYANAYIQRKLEQEELSFDDEFIDSLRSENNYYVEKIVDQLIQKKLRGKIPPENFEDRERLKNKLINFLISKGHNYQEVKDKVRECFNERTHS